MKWNSQEFFSIFLRQNMPDITPFLSFSYSIILFLLPFLSSLFSRFVFFSSDHVFQLLFLSISHKILIFCLSTKKWSRLSHFPRSLLLFLCFFPFFCFFTPFFRHLKPRLPFFSLFSAPLYSFFTPFFLPFQFLLLSHSFFSVSFTFISPLFSHYSPDSLHFFCQKISF